MATNPPLLKTTGPLSTFIRLSTAVWLYDPPLLASAGFMANGCRQPSTTIVFCGWLNASLKNIAYYIGHYKSLYPHARIILLTINTTEIFLQSESRRREAVQPAVDAILARGQHDETILVHSFSSGGGKRLYGVAGAYRTITGHPFTPKAVVFDSGPGIPSFQRDLHSLMVAGRNLNWLLWVPFAAVNLVIVSVLNICVHCMPRWFWRNLAWGPFEGVNEPKLLSEKTVRGYMYSVRDRAVDWRDVENHASIAKKKGFTVFKQSIENAEHVQLFKGEGGEMRYWGFVKKVWGFGKGSHK